MKVADAHIRFFSHDLYEFRTVPGPDGERVLAAKNIACDADELARRRGRLVAGMDECGVARAVVHAAVPQEVEAVGRAARDSGGRLVAIAMVDPGSPASHAALECLQPDLGFCGVALSSFGRCATLDGHEAVFHFAASHGMAVWIDPVEMSSSFASVFDPTSRPGAGDRGDTHFRQLACARPDLAFIVPNLGAGWFDEFLETGSGCRNVYAETTGLRTITSDAARPGRPARLLASVREAFGTGRMLFASNSSAASGGYDRSTLDLLVRAMKGAGFSESDRTGVMGENLLLLFGLS